MVVDLPQLAVDRDEVARARQGEHDLELLPAGVPRDVQRRARAHDHVGAASVQVVDDAIDRLLVAGDGARRQHDDVPGVVRHLLVIVEGYPGQGRHRLPLAAGGDQDDAAGG